MRIIINKETEDNLKWIKHFVGRSLPNIIYDMTEREIYRMKNKNNLLYFYEKDGSSVVITLSDKELNELLKRYLELSNDKVLETIKDFIKERDKK